MNFRDLFRRLEVVAITLSAVLCGDPGFADSFEPTFETIAPPGAAAGSSVDVTISGTASSGLRSIRSSIPKLGCEWLGENRCKITIPASTLPGLYDVWAVCDKGVTSARRFSVSNRGELLEAAGNESPSTAMPVSLDCVVSGRMNEAGDLDYYKFEARQGQRVLIECWAERIDSRLRAVLELFDAAGRRLAVNRGYFGSDPLIDLRVPADGTYTVKVQDLVFSGGNEHYYRLGFDSGPRVAFTIPSVIPQGKASRVKLFGWNLKAISKESPLAGGETTRTPFSVVDGSEFDEVDVVIPADQAKEIWPLLTGCPPTALPLAGFPYHVPGGNVPTVIGVTELPVEVERDDHHQPDMAQRISIPCEVSGRLARRNEQDWYAIEARQGEVLYFDVHSQRLSSPTDLQLSILDATGSNVLAEFNDEVANAGGLALSMSHLDPSGRWLVPADGRYLIMVRNLINNQFEDHRRLYRVSVRREDPDFRLAVVRRTSTPGGLNLRRGGREAFDLLVQRQRGLQGTIRVAAQNLPAGIECPDVFLGPGVDRTTMVISAEQSATDQLFALDLEGFAEGVGRRPVRSSTVVRSGTPNGWSRLTSEFPVAVTGDAPCRITAAIQDTMDHHLYGNIRMRYSPGTVLDVAVTVERFDSRPQADTEFKLVGVGLPPGLLNQTVIVPTGARQAFLSFSLPRTLATGQYTLAIAGETTFVGSDGKTETVTVISNAVSFKVEAAGFFVEIDPFARQRVKRGETFRMKYSTERQNGFIGKIHTELASPGVVTNVPGFRSMGVTFVGQTDRAEIQVTVNDDAPLGHHRFVRLLSVGIVEDQPAFFGAAFTPLEIVE